MARAGAVGECWMQSNYRMGDHAAEVRFSGRLLILTDSSIFIHW
jgi:hypothetical protein